MFTRKTKSVLLVLIMLVSVAGVAFAAAPSVDTETSETSQTSDLTDGSTQAYNESTASNFSWSADSNDSKVEVMQNGTEIAEWSPDPYYTNSTSGTSYYNVSIADDGSDYKLDADAGENVTLTFTITNNTSADSPDTTNVTVYFNNSEEEAFSRADSAEVAEDGGLVSSLSLPFSNDSEPTAAKATETVGVTSNTTTVTFQSNQENLTDALGETHSAAKDSGFTTEGYVMVEGSMVPLFTSSSDVPDWVGNQTYATVDDAGAVTVYNLDTDSSEIELVVVGNEQADFHETFGMLRSYDAGLQNAITLADVDANGNPAWVEA